jgi:Serine carboxypeptidase
MLFRSWVAHTVSAASLLFHDAHALLPRNQETRSVVTRRAEPRGSGNDSHGYSNSSFRFYNEKTARRSTVTTFGHISRNTAYFIKSLPDFPFNLGEIYSGNIPVDLNDTTRQLFFVFQPTTGPPVDEITLFFQGGPGCSTLQAFIKENGRFTWQPGTFAPVENPYAWTNVTNMLWYHALESFEPR